MSVHLIVPAKDQVQSNAIQLISEEPSSFWAQAVPAGTKSSSRWSGILGLIGVGAILASSIYSIVRYLL